MRGVDITISSHNGDILLSQNGGPSNVIARSVVEDGVTRIDFLEDKIITDPTGYSVVESVGDVLYRVDDNVTKFGGFSIMRRTGGSLNAPTYTYRVLLSPPPVNISPFRASFPLVARHFDDRVGWDFDAVFTQAVADMFPTSEAAQLAWLRYAESFADDLQGATDFISRVSNISNSYLRLSEKLRVIHNADKLFKVLDDIPDPSVRTNLLRRLDFYVEDASSLSIVSNLFGAFNDVSPVNGYQRLIARLADDAFVVSIAKDPNILLIYNGVLKYSNDFASNFNLTMYRAFSEDFLFNGQAGPYSFQRYIRDASLQDGQQMMNNIQDMLASNLFVPNGRVNFRPNSGGMIEITANGNISIGLFDDQFLVVNRVVTEGSAIPNSTILDYYLVEKNGLVEFAQN